MQSGVLSVRAEGGRLFLGITFDYDAWRVGWPLLYSAGRLVERMETVAIALEDPLQAFEVSRTISSVDAREISRMGRLAKVLRCVEA